MRVKHGIEKMYSLHIRMELNVHLLSAMYSPNMVVNWVVSDLYSVKKIKDTLL